MRSGRDGSAAHSATPIYDALYSEYLRAFRTLPGDRSGEEDLGFKAFGTGLHSSRGGFYGYGSYVSPAGHGSHGGYGGHSAHSGSHSNSGTHQGSWHSHSTGRHSAHQPAALPPAPRKGS
ncbi:hypothetical protein ABZ070_26415 [Streptomyces sp. NPDC006283]|uniref:hypothetical protein n=1 Tax=Streptomyces sp. NPDC006283 TaxID=3156741 RepID=UPI0033A37331